MSWSEMGRRFLLGLAVFPAVAGVAAIVVGFPEGFLGLCLSVFLVFIAMVTG
jgi:hypothetical protein